MDNIPTSEIDTSVADEAHFQTGDVLTISGGHAIHDTYTAFLSPLLPAFVENFDLSKTGAGLLSVFMQGPSLLQPLIGHLADNFSLQYFVILAPTVTAVAMSLLGVAPGYAALALLLVVAGASTASLHAVGPVMVARFSGQSLGRGMGIWMVGGELGRTLGPVIITATVQFLGLGSTPWLMVGGFVASAMLYARFRSVSGQSPNSGNGLPWRQALRDMGPLLWPLAGIVIARSFMVSALTTYLPLFLSEEGAELWLAGVSLSILEAAGVVGALLGGHISDRIGRRRVLFVSMLVTSVLMLVFLALGGWARLLLLLGLGLTALSVTPVVMALVQESFPENRALANGLYMAMSFALRSLVVVGVGALGDLVGLRWAFVVSAIVPLFGLPLLFLLPEKRNG